MLFPLSQPCLDYPRESKNGGVVQAVEFDCWILLDGMICFRYIMYLDRCVISHSPIITSMCLFFATLWLYSVAFFHTSIGSLMVFACFDPEKTCVIYCGWLQNPNHQFRGSSEHPIEHPMISRVSPCFNHPPLRLKLPFFKRPPQVTEVPRQASGAKSCSWPRPGLHKAWGDRR